MRFVLIGATVWAAASLVLGVVVGRWIATPDQDCPCGSCVLGREVGE